MFFAHHVDYHRNSLSSRIFYFFTIQDIGMAEASGEPAVEEMVEVEIQDVAYWLRLISSKITDIERNVKVVKEGLGHLQALSEVTEHLQEQEQNEIQEDIRKLSPTASRLFDSLSGHTLNKENFKNLLMFKSFGKPKPPVLPVIRSFSSNVDGVKSQLLCYRNALDQSHLEYMNEHKKDLNLIKRIDRLVKNINEELSAETVYGLHQTSMNEYVTH
ncbi:hypothetical protein TNIN_368731 [Trichonephila inaurata madagascariensis]|uniref:Uncharacterized protein n=1 Tax=Trichonephila inaurata madagascariensis TaxID=2747483 RepID=A0A8X7C8V9_9ARAC|nr:hypothetical protein TNIN_368731 [Trichonephila inaurata madagascariensis]